MLSVSVKKDIIDSIVTVAYYWMGEQNQQATISIIGMLEQIDCNPLDKKVSDLHKDFQTFFHNPDESLYQKIMVQGEDEEKKLLWVAGVCVMNLFKSANFELGYTVLMDMSINWPELYSSVISTLRKQPFKDEVVMWLVTHFIMARDLVGEDEINMMGYSVKKIAES